MGDKFGTLSHQRCLSGNCRGGKQGRFPELPRAGLFWVLGEKPMGKPWKGKYDERTFLQ